MCKFSYKNLFLIVADRRPTHAGLLGDLPEGKTRLPQFTNLALGGKRQGRARDALLLFSRPSHPELDTFGDDAALKLSEAGDKGENGGAKIDRRAAGDAA